MLAEALANLGNIDTALMVLGTKAFVAKEELVSNVKYGLRDLTSSTKKDSDKEKSKDESNTKEETSEVVEETGKVDSSESTGEWSYIERLRKKSEDIFKENAERNKKEAEEKKVENISSEIKESSQQLESLLEEVASVEGGEKIIAQFNEYIGGAIENLANFVKDSKVEKSSREVNIPVQRVDENGQIVGMDFSNLQNGVTYQEPVNTHTLVIEAGGNGRPVTQQDLDVALLKEQMNENQIPLNESKNKGKK